MALVDKLPALADDELANLLANAERLVQSGTPAQQAAAAALLPAIQDEIGSRKAAKAASRPARAPAAGTPKRRKAKTPPPPEADAAES